MSLLYKYKYDIISVYVFLEAHYKHKVTNNGSQPQCEHLIIYHGLLLHGLELSFSLLIDGDVVKSSRYPRLVEALRRSWPA